PLGVSVIFAASPPVIGRTKICAFSSFAGPTAARNARRSPLGDHRGKPASFRLWVRARCVPLVISTDTKSRSNRSSCMFARDTTHTTTLPSGAICGSETFTLLAKSSISIRRVCAENGVVHAMQHPTSTSEQNTLNKLSFAEKLRAHVVESCLCEILMLLGTS